MIRGDITYKDKLGELRLDISHPNSRGINFVFVEGESDIKLFRKLFDLDKCKVENIPGGKKKLEECVSDLLSIYNLIIGIRDADFIHLDDTAYTENNMFLTDCHDIEMTMLSQSLVLDAILCEFTSLPKNEYCQFLDNMMKSIEMVSYLKWLNDKENLDLTFKGCGFQDLINFDNLDISFPDYLSRVLAKSTSAKITCQQTINSKISVLQQATPSSRQLTNGHDLVITFAKFFREVIKHKGLTDENIASTLRIAFTVEHFKSTSLYESLLGWMNQNNTELFSN